MQTVITSADLHFSFESPVLVERVTFERPIPNPSMVKLIADKLDGFLISEFNGPVDIWFDHPQHPRHPDLLPVFSGEYVLTGMVENDKLTITFRLADPKQEPIRLSERDRDRMIDEYCDEQARRRSRAITGEGFGR